MDSFLVRKRPFEDHEKKANYRPPSYSSSSNSSCSDVQHPLNQRPSQKQKTSHSYTTTSNSSFQSASAYRASSSSSSSTTLAPTTPFSNTSFANGRIQAEFSPTRSYAPATKQITIHELRKVTDVDEVECIGRRLCNAHSSEEWSRVLQLLTKLDNMFISMDVLKKTGIGKIVAKLKKINAGTSLERDMVEIQSAREEAKQVDGEAQLQQESGKEKTDGSIGTASNIADVLCSSSPSPSPPAASPSASNKKSFVDLTEDSLPIPTLINATSTSSSSNSATSPTSALRLTITALSFQLVDKWKRQVFKEADAAAHKPFDEYSTFPDRVKTYKAFYYRLSTTDMPETHEQKAHRRSTMQHLVPQDVLSSRLAMELEGILFKHQQKKMLEQLERERKSRNTELLSASSDSDEQSRKIVTTSIPTHYVYHARVVLSTIGEAKQLSQLRQLIPSYDTSSAAAAAMAAQVITPDERKKLLESIVLSSKTFQ